MNNFDATTFVERTCTEINATSQPTPSFQLGKYRDLPAYVLLGNPGSGKTVSFKREAMEAGGLYISARDFIVLNLKHDDENQPIFIDGLDEIRVGSVDGRTPLDNIRRKLEQLDFPKFRLSCREADWLGNNDIDALNRSTSGNVLALRLDQLSDENVCEILGQCPSVLDSHQFMETAKGHGIGELLRNPQSLGLLVRAVESKEWPESRYEVYEMACTQLVQERNQEHRRAKQNNLTQIETLLDAAGFLCAIQLLAGKSGFTVDVVSSDDPYICLSTLLNPNQVPLIEVLKTGLFAGDGANCSTPIHRSVAEFLGARYLCKLVESDGLPFGRVLAMMIAKNGGILTDLRGLSAWNAAHSSAWRRPLVERDPLGVVLYGDVRSFSVNDKLLILKAMHREASRYPWFRTVDWSSSSSGTLGNIDMSKAFGALGTADMSEAFIAILSSPKRDNADQALLDCVLEAIQYGECVEGLCKPLLNVVRDASYWPKNRMRALKLFTRMCGNANAELLELTEDILSEKVQDADDELLGLLLRMLYPVAISPEKILDFLHKRKKEYLIGVYSLFWNHIVVDVTTKTDLPVVLDQLGFRRNTLRAALDRGVFEKLAGNFLLKMLENIGDSISNEELYNWLSIGLNQNEMPGLHRDQADAIAAWFQTRPDRYKAMIDLGISAIKEGSDRFYLCESRLFFATPSDDMPLWYLKKCEVESEDERSKYYFEQAVRILLRKNKQKYLALADLEFLEAWLQKNPTFRYSLEQFITCPIGTWEQEHAILERQHKLEVQESRLSWTNQFRRQLEEYSLTNLPFETLSNLAALYNGIEIDLEGDTPRLRLENFFDGDVDIVATIYSIFRRTLDREDLPTIEETADSELKGLVHPLCAISLIGMNELYNSEPAAVFALDDILLTRMLAFQLKCGTDIDPGWFKEILLSRPAFVANAFISYTLPLLLGGKEYISSIYALVNDSEYSAVAKIVLPKLLENFPNQKQTGKNLENLGRLLKGSLRYLDSDSLLHLVDSKLAIRRIDVPQKIFWLSCGMLVDSTRYMEKLNRFVKMDEERRNVLAEFLHFYLPINMVPKVLRTEKALAKLIELIGQDTSPHVITGAFRVTRASEFGDLVRTLLNTLRDMSTESALQEIKHLLTLPQLSDWHEILINAEFVVQIALRKRSISYLSGKDISLVFGNLKPINAADLAEITFHYLRDIGSKIRHGNTNDYRQYWSYDSKNKCLSISKPENDCRDALLSDLSERFGRLGIDAQREGSYADDKRADIRVSFGGSNGFDIPIEIKKDRHKDVWTAIEKQLIPRYLREAKTGGNGIYVVLWFGDKEMPLPPSGARPQSAEELERRLEEIAVLHEQYRIQICVIDCAVPTIH